MKLTLKDNKILKDCFNSISTIIDEAVLEFSADGLKISAIDSKKIIFIEMKLKTDLFDEYECDDAEEIPIDTVIFNDILKHCNSTDTLQLESNCKLKIIFKGKITREFKMTLSYPKDENPKCPVKKLPIKLTIPTKVLKDSIKDIAAYSDKIQFIVNPTSLLLIGKNEKVKVKNRFKHGSDVNSIYRSMYSIEYVSNILKSSNLNENCILSLGNNTNIEFTFFIGKSSYIRYVLAPRLREEDISNFRY